MTGPSPTARPAGPGEGPISGRTRAALWALSSLVLAYALLAGCYTLRNFDLGWQLAAGREIAGTGQIPDREIFSYTAAGRPWVYPAGAELLFYGLFRSGGYAALTILGMLVCGACVALILATNREAIERPGIALALLWLVVLAIPTIAARSSARADVFTLVLTGATIHVVSRYYRGLSSRLYLLPVVFVLWANLHQGFVFGLVVVAVFAVALAAKCFGTKPEVRALGRSRFTRLAAWGMAAAAAVLLNPFGWRLYASLASVRKDMAFQRGFIGEASPVAIGWWRLLDAVRFPDPDSGIWLLAALSVCGIAVAAWKKQLAPALLLAIFLVLGLRYARAQALFAIVACTVLPGVLASLAASRTPAPSAGRAGRFAAGAVACLLVIVVGMRAADLVSNRYYVMRADTASFGPGISWWFPERALDFIAGERLPGHIYHDYNAGGWVMWRLWPRYRDYIDGRAQPFSPEVFLEQQEMLAVPPDSSEWQALLDRRGINTLLISLARFGGYRLSPAALCASSGFRLVYMDEVAGVWLRVRPENQAWLDRLGRACDVELEAPRGGAAARYNFFVNAGALYTALGRLDRALDMYREAENIFPADPNLRLALAQYWQARGSSEQAAREYRLALSLSDSAGAWHGLGTLEANAGHFLPAAEAFGHAAERSVLPHESYRMRGECLVAANRPGEALRAFALARSTSPYGHAPAGRAGQAFLAAVASGEQRARALLAR